MDEISSGKICGLSQPLDLRKGRVVSAQHFADSQLEEVKESFMRIRETQTHKKIIVIDRFENGTIVDRPNIIRTVHLERRVARD
jgi:hypothetical protein